MQEIPKAQKSSPPARETPAIQNRDLNGNLITEFQQKAVQSLVNSQGQKLLNPGKNLPSTSGIVGFNQGINETVSLIGANQQLDQSNNSTLLPGAIVQIPKTPNGEMSRNQKNLAIQSGEITPIAEQKALEGINEVLSLITSDKPAEQIQETKETGLGILGKMGNW